MKGAAGEASSDLGEAVSRRRALALLIAALAFVALIGAGFIALVIPRPPPAIMAVPPPLGPPLTRHLVFVIIDGLRYDIGTDPALMPELSRRMTERASAEGWSGPISMTSAAVLTFATGQRGDIEHIIKNEAGSPAPYNSLMQNALAAGLITAAAGERAWFRLFPGMWSMAHPDPYGVAVDVDYNAEIFAATDELLASPTRPALLVAHFVTPDHQAHAYGVLSDRYRAHMRAFDRRLAELLSGLPPDTTVIITSDHGMTDTGSHGSDTPVQRRSPFVAYGPGIAPKLGSQSGSTPRGRVDQIDVPGTMAVLLGVSAPAHGRGHILVDWLDIPDEERARIACADLGRLRAYASASLSPQARAGVGVAAACEPPPDGARPEGRPSPREKIEGAARAAAEADEALGQRMVAGLPLGSLVPVAALVGALALALAALWHHGLSRGAALRAAVLASVAVSIAAALTYSLELLPGRWPGPVRVLLYVIAHVALLAGILRPRAAAALLDRSPIAGAVALPGILVISATRTTQVEALVIAAIVGGYVHIAGVPRVDAGSPSSFLQAIRAARGRIESHFIRDPRSIRAAAALLLLALLAPVAVREAEFFPRSVLTSPGALLALAIASIAILGVERALRARLRGDALLLPGVAVGVAVAVASLLLRRSAPAPVCLAAWLGLPALAFIALRRGHRALAELLLLASYAWVSRDAELPILAVTILVAGLCGDAFGESLKGRLPRPSSVLLLVTFLFALTYIQRVGVQLGLDFVHSDWGAGAFRQPGVSVARVGAALVYKHAFARGAVLYAVLAALPAAHRAWTARGLFAAELLRAATLMITLHVCRGSFWTPMHVIGDLPHALSAILVSALALLVIAHQGGAIGYAVRSSQPK